MTDALDGFEIHVAPPLRSPGKIRSQIKYQPTMVSNIVWIWCEMDFATIHSREVSELWMAMAGMADVPPLNIDNYLSLNDLLSSEPLPSGVGG